MRYIKRPKYKFHKEKVSVKAEKDLTAEELYQEQLKSKRRMARKR